MPCGPFVNRSLLKHFSHSNGFPLVSVLPFTVTISNLLLFTSLFSTDFLFFLLQDLHSTGEETILNLIDTTLPVDSYVQTFLSQEWE